MTATNQMLFHIFLATVLVNALLETSVAYEHGPEHDEDPKHHHSDAANETDGHERKFHWPSSVTIGIHREANVDGPDHSNPGNDTVDGARKFHWPSSASLTIHRAGQVDSDAARQMDGPNAPGNYTDGERKFHWPGSVSFEIHREAKVDGPDHPTPGNDTEDGERRFRWPSSMGFTISRAGPAMHHGNPLAPEGDKPDQEDKSFGFSPVLVPCNHTTQAGHRCADCTHTLLCYSNNLGVKRDCGPRYCDDGRCSSQPTANCADASNE
ncbi:uncharacterized protein LOC121735386 [Aricia agestis]|uniref:uncharacterized protein LOC121735386 n=1 Tax=Aricia agestis TaxID=91739 RepID=UPI001C20B625|nr:uncharacterized protein LOC121735386 [Aricia agestis]